MTYRLLFFFLPLALLFSEDGRAQNIQLRVQTDDEKSDSIAAYYIPKRVFTDQKTLEQHLSNAKDSLLKYGYFKHQIIRSNHQTDTSYAIHFTSREKTKAFKLKYELPSIRAYAKNLALRVDSSYIYIQPEKLESVLEDFLEMDSKNGKPLTSYTIQDLTLSKDTAVAELSIANNQNRKLTEVIIKGYEKFPESFLSHFAKLQKNTIYNEASITKSIERLKQLNFIRQVKEPDILFKKDTTTLYLYLEKQSANQFEGFLGFASEESSNNLRINGYLNLNLLNTLNYGERLQLQFLGNGNNQQQLDASLRIPYLFKTPLSITPSLRLFRQDSSFANSQTKLKVDYTWSARFVVHAMIGQISSNRLTPTSSSTIEDFKKTVLSTGFEISNTSASQNPFDSKYVRMEVGFSSRKSAAKQNKQNQLLLDFEAAYIFNFSEDHKFYLKNSTAYLSPQNVYENEMNRFGGMQTLRGYNENSLYASFYSAMQAEYRYEPANNLILNTVFDTAYYENPLTQESDLIFGLGFGGSLATNAGWLSLNLANGLQPGESFQFSKSILHFRLVSEF